MKKWCDINKMATIVHQSDFQQVYFAYTSNGNWNFNWFILPIHQKVTEIVMKAMYINILNIKIYANLSLNILECLMIPAIE